MDVHINRETDRLQSEWTKVCGLPEGVTRASDEDVRVKLPDWGFFHLTIPDAAQLIVLDMWFAGAMPDIQEPDDFDGEADDPRLTALLAETTQQFHVRLMNAIQSGSLEADLVQRDLNDNLIPNRVYISFWALTEWLGERGYEYGDVMTEWVENQEKRAEALLSEAEFYRHATREEIRQIEQARFMAQYSVETRGNVSEQPLEVAYKAAIAEIKHLRKALSAPPNMSPAKVDRPISTRPRRTLLTIIAALCDYSAIEPNKRGASTRIAAMTEEIGAPVTAETIADLLKEIPDALETRMK
ncbi:MAG: hypothetical protein AB7E12_10505 [Burkholderiaceae bacterium]